MKKFFIFFILILCNLHLFLKADINQGPNSTCYENLAFCEPDCGLDRTFMFTRPIYRNLGAQLSLWHDFVFNKCSATDYSFQVIPIFGQSLGSRKQRKYFLFDKKAFLTVKGDNAPDSIAPGQLNPFRRDIRAEWLQLPSDFQGGFTVNPFQRQFGLWIEAKANLRSCFDNEFFHHFWVGIAAPFQMIENDIRLHEVPPLNPGQTFPTNITEALGNPSLLYLKFGPKKRLSSVAELNLRFGTNFLDCDGFQIGTYSFFVIPTFKTNVPEFVFSPFMGNNRHFGFGQGVTFQLPLNNDTHCKLVAFFLYVENIYFIRNFQLRTLDLRFKPYSRYLLLVSRQGRRNIPAPQVLTRKVRVRPYNMADLSTGFRYQENGFEFELSYNLWARSEQRLKLRHCFPEDFGIQGSDNLTINGEPATASASTIRFQAQDDREINIFFPLPDPQRVFVPIKEEDLELLSGAARGALNHRVQAAGGFLWETNCIELLIGLGGYIEIPQFNTDLKRWGVWAKWGISF